MDKRSAKDHLFRPEVLDEAAAPEDWPEPESLQVAGTGDGAIELRLLFPGGQHHDRLLEAETVTCEAGHWLAKGKKDRLPAFMLLTGSVGSKAEDLRLSRDHEGALLVHGSYRSGGLLFLIPTGTTTDQMLVRFPLLAQ